MTILIKTLKQHQKWLGYVLLMMASTGSWADHPILENANPTEFECSTDTSVYQVATANSQLFKLSVSGTTGVVEAIGTQAEDQGFIDEATYNGGDGLNAGWGYNEQDGLAYGVQQNGNTLYALDGAGTFYELGTVANITAGFAGDILPNGTMVFRGTSATTLMTIDLGDDPDATGTGTGYEYAISGSFTLTGFGSLPTPVYADLAYNPADGMLYSIDYRNGRAFYIDPNNFTGTTGNVTLTYVTNTSSGLTDAYGAIWFDTDGYMYAYNNADNKIYWIDVGNSDTNLGSGEAIFLADYDGDTRDIAAKNDGFSCRLPSLVPFVDHGDANSSYGDAPHTLPSSGITIYLGNNTPDYDSTLNINTGSVGDDNDGNDDEDGITLPSSVTQGETVTITADVNGTDGYLQGWIDWDNNGTFDALERIATNVQDTDNDSIITLSVTVPSNATTTQTSARFRWSTESNLGATGLAPDGEVEDYLLTVAESLSISGRVYDDTNVDGINDSTESGIEDVTIVLLDTDNNVCTSVQTDGSGYYSFLEVSAGSYIVYEAANETTPTPINCNTESAEDPSTYSSTTDNVLAEFTVTDSSISDKDFGDIGSPSFEPDNTGQVLPGNVIFYSHHFTSPAEGSVTFSATSTANDNNWTSILYLDADCDGSLNETEASTSINGEVIEDLTADSTTCIINKVFAPSNVPTGDSITQTISAVFDTGLSGGTQTLTVQDTTSVQQGSSLSLTKTVQNLTSTTDTLATSSSNTAVSGDTLLYQIYYQNKGTGAITDLTINDVAPSYTLLIENSASCATTPTGDNLECEPFEEDDNIIRWSFDGGLLGGEEGIVNYQVEVE